MNAMKEQFLNGEIILIDKPLGWTSFQVVNKIRWLIRSTYGIKKIKVGHAGTLDPSGYWFINNLYWENDKRNF